MTIKNKIFALGTAIIFSICLYACGIPPILDISESGTEYLKAKQTEPNDLLVGFESGKLVYCVDTMGNRVPDFSGVGYMNSEEAIPTVPVVETIYPYTGPDSDWDDTPRIQAAINTLESQPLIGGTNFRGTLYFAPGEYRIRDEISVNQSGIVLRGAGAGSSGTKLIATDKKQYILIHFVGFTSQGQRVVTGNSYAIVDSYVPIGATQVTLDQSADLSVGDWVYLRRKPKAAWLAGIGMDVYGWGTEEYTMNYERRITQIDLLAGKYIVHLDAPVVDIIDENYAEGYLVKIVSDNRITHCGIEDMRLESVYDSETDEEHAWTGVRFTNTVNGWAKNIDAYYFGLSAVRTISSTRWITVDNCRMIDPKSQNTGSRRYSFEVTGHRHLVKNCYARNGRHDYMTGPRVPGPSVFFNCVSENQLSDNGPHGQWATGILYDRVVGDGELNVRNRTYSGISHGWAGAQHMLWRCEGTTIRLQRPPLGHINWAVGSTNVTGAGSVSDWSPDEPIGGVQEIAPVPSLFEQQLAERLGL